MKRQIIAERFRGGRLSSFSAWSVVSKASRKTVRSISLGLRPVQDHLPLDPFRIASLLRNALADEDHRRETIADGGEALGVQDSGRVQPGVGPSRRNQHQGLHVLALLDARMFVVRQRPIVSRPDHGNGRAHFRADDHQLVEVQFF